MSSKWDGMRDEWAQLYQDGLSVARIAKRAGTCASVVHSALKEMGVSLRTSTNSAHQVCNQLRNEWVTLYANGKTPGEIGTQYGVDRETVRRQLLQSGTEIRGSSEAQMRYLVGHPDAFEAIDSEEKAYWLGFLMADGYVQTKAGKKGSGCYRLSLGISIHDRPHLERFRDYLQSDAPITVVEHRRKGQDKPYSRMVYLHVFGKRLIEGLVRCGCVPQKTFTVQFPDHVVPPHLIRHFVRGNFDGDGCMYVNQNVTWRVGNAQWTSGSQAFLQGMERTLRGAGVQNLHLVQKPHSKAHVLQVRSVGEIAKLYHWMYDGATVYLPRKKAKFEELLGITTPSTEGAAI